jgi:hypothetical protein
MIRFMVLVIIIVSFRHRTKNRSDAECEKSDKGVFHLQCLYGTHFPQRQILMAKSDQIPRRRASVRRGKVICSGGVRFPARRNLQQFWQFRP